MAQPPLVRRLALVLVAACPALTPAALAQSDKPIREAWDAVYVGDAKVGSMHLWIKPVKDSRGRELSNVRVDYDLTFQRGRDSAHIKMLYGTIETAEGQVLRLDTRTQASGQDIRTYGDVVDGNMKLVLEVGGQRSQIEVPWGDDVRGPYGSEMSLSREPLGPGESRAVKTYIPDLNKVCLTLLKAADYEEIPLGPAAEKHRLLRVESTVSDGEGKSLPSLDATLWVDGTGQIMKSYTKLLGGMYTYRTTKAGALAKNSGKFQLLEASILRTPQPIADSEKTRHVLYRLRGTSVAKLFPSDQRQVSTPEGEGVCRLLVKTDSPQVGELGPEQVGEEFLRANPLVNSADGQVIRHMKAAVGRRTDPWEKAVAIEDWVFRNMRKKNFSTAFAPAEEVARTLSGDCTEHGVLTAAMCRAAGIPARCVVGLVYAETLGGFGPHMWNEVYVNRRWVAIDATFNQAQVDATHLKLSDTSLDGVAPFEAFLPVLEAINALKIEPIETR
jgi:hypothetical protein